MDMQHARIQLHVITWSHTVYMPFADVILKSTNLGTHRTPVVPKLFKEKAKSTIF